MAVITDKRLAVDENQDGEAESWTADLTEAGDYYAFGGKVVDRQYNPNEEAYNYGFNGQQKSEGVHVGSYTALYWEYDARIGRRWNVDPVWKNGSPYASLGNNLILKCDPDGNTEYDTYAQYAATPGTKAIDKDKWTGQDGHWLKSDRIGRLARWSNAMEFITRNIKPDLLAYQGSNPSGRTFSFSLVRDYYVWAQHEMEARGGTSRWAIGASFLCDELADTYQFEKDGRLEVASGNLPGVYNLGKGILTDLNRGIFAYALERFKGVLYDGKDKIPTTMLEGYQFDLDFVEREQSRAESPGMKVYADYHDNNPTQIKGLKVLASSGDIAMMAKHTVPLFSHFKGNLSDRASGWNKDLRVNLPMMMLHPILHPMQNPAAASIVTESVPGMRQVRQSAREINQWHRTQMKY